MSNNSWKKAARALFIHFFALLVFLSLGLFLNLFFFGLDGAMLGVGLWILFCFCYLLVTDEAKERFWDSITGGR